MRRLDCVPVAFAANIELPVVDPRLSGGPGFDLLTLLAFLPSVISSLFTQNEVGPRVPRTSPARSVTDFTVVFDRVHLLLEQAVVLPRAKTPPAEGYWGSN